jgi:hypothetical protein
MEKGKTSFKGGAAMFRGRNGGPGRGRGGARRGIG